MPSSICVSINNSGSTRVQLDTALWACWAAENGRKEKSLTAALELSLLPPPHRRSCSHTDLLLGNCNFRELSRSPKSSPQGGTGVSTAIQRDEYRSVCIDPANYSAKNKSTTESPFPISCCEKRCPPPRALLLRARGVGQPREARGCSRHPTETPPESCALVLK